MSIESQRRLIIMAMLICLWPMELALGVYMTVTAVKSHLEGGLTFTETWEAYIEGLEESWEKLDHWIRTGEYIS